MCIAKAVYEMSRTRLRRWKVDILFSNNYNNFFTELDQEVISNVVKIKDNIGIGLMIL